jgi:hypothetical protein
MGLILLLLPQGFQPGSDWLWIGGISPVDMGRFFAFRLFLSDSPHLTTSHAGKAKFVGLPVYFIYYIFHRNSNFAPKSRAVIGWCQVGKLGDPPVSRDLIFLGKFCNSWIPHVKLHAIGYFFQWKVGLLISNLCLEDRHRSGIVSDVFHLFHVYVLTFWHLLLSALCSREISSNYLVEWFPLGIRRRSFYFCDKVKEPNQI